MQLNPKKRKGLYIALALVVVVGGVVFYMTRHHHSLQQTVAVTVSTATIGDLSPQIDTIGTASAMNEVTIKSQVTGQLSQIPVQSGQMVKTGDILFIIDPAPFQAALNQAIGQQAKDKALLTFAEQQLQRYSQLAQQGYISKDFFAQIVANVKSAKATLTADTATVAAAQLTLSYCTIKAPISGRLGDIGPNIGDLISANADTAMVSIKQFSPIEVQFSLPAKNVALARAALSNPHRQVVTATTSDDPQLHAQGTIDFVDNQIDAATGSISMKAQFANPDAAIWPGELLQIRVSGQPERQVVLIPNEAINQHQNGQFYVYRLDNSQHARLIPVTIGSSQDGLTAIKSGLNAGDRVVTKGQFRLNDGMLTTIVA